jgi:hypothetical protein
MTEPTLCIVQYYQITTVPGDFGATRNIVGDTLIEPPHSKSTRYVKTRTVTTSTTSVTSSVLESRDASVAKDLSQSIRNSAEQSQAEDSASQQSQSRDRSDWKFDASFHGEANVGLSGGSADADAHASSRSNAVHDASSQSNEIRDAYRSAVDSAINQQVTKTESFRKQTATTVNDATAKLEEGESIETFEIDNPGPESVTFACVQLSVERLTALSLVDAKLGFFDARAKKFGLVPLSGMDTLLNRVITEEGNRALIRKIIISMLAEVADYRDEIRNFIVETPKPGSATETYWRVIPDLQTEVTIQRPGGLVKKFAVPGIATKAQYSVLNLPKVGLVRLGVGGGGAR